MAEQEEKPIDPNSPRRFSKEVAKLLGSLVDLAVKQVGINRETQIRLDRLESASQDPAIAAESEAMRQKMDVMEARIRILAAQPLDLGEFRLGRMDIDSDQAGGGEMTGHDEESMGGPNGTAGQIFTLDFTATLKARVQHEDDGGYSAEVPGLPGCVTEGDTLEGLRANLREVVEGWLEAKEDLKRLHLAARAKA